MASPAHADLYRWIDPATGTVKLSSLPPSDASIEAEVVRYSSPGLPKPAPGSKPTANVSVGELEARWRSLLMQITSLSPQDIQQNTEGVRQSIETYEAVRAELDRQDPAGAARRKAEATAVADRLRQGFVPR